MRANAAGGNSTSAATGVGNPGEEAAAQAAGAPAAAPAIDPKKIARFKELLAKAGGAAAPAAGGAAQASGSPAKPAAGFANTGGGAAVGNPNMTKQGVARQ
jgi:hypothetical protein